MTSTAVRAWLTRTAATALAAGAAILALPAPAHADLPRQVTSPRNLDPVKTVQAHCPAGTVVLGGGAAVDGGGGNVALVALVPDPTLAVLTARGVARTAHAEPWAVTVRAVCGSLEPLGTPALVTSGPVSVTGGGGGAGGGAGAEAEAVTVAHCPAGQKVIGTGFDFTALAATALLTGLIVDDDLRGVGLRLSLSGPGAAPPVAYGICVPHELLTTVNVELRRLGPSWSPMGADPVKTARVTFPAMSVPTAFYGVGGVVAGPAGDVFITGLLPAADLQSVVVTAARSGAPAGPVTARPMTARTATARTATGDGDDWAVGAEGAGAAVYYGYLP